METIRVWRICRREYKESAFTGEGAKHFGGRFNSEGVAAVYTSGSFSLSLLEILVQTNDRSYLRHCVIFSADIPASLIDIPNRTDFPDGWDQIPYGQVSQHFGDNWLTSNTNPVLRIPSVVVPIEFNYVLNPNHPDFERIHVSESGETEIDPRLFTLVGNM